MAKIGSYAYFTAAPLGNKNYHLVSGAAVLVLSRRLYNGNTKIKQNKTKYTALSLIGPATHSNSPTDAFSVSFEILHHLVYSLSHLGTLLNEFVEEGVHAEKLETPRC